MSSLTVFSDHSDAVWCLFNNAEASYNQQHLLFSASASGSLLCHDIEKGSYYYNLFINRTILWISYESYCIFNN